MRKAVKGWNTTTKQPFFHKRLKKNILMCKKYKKLYDEGKGGFLCQGV